MYHAFPLYPIINLLLSNIITKITKFITRVTMNDYFHVMKPDLKILFRIMAKFASD